MGVRFACHECHKRLNIKETLAGKRGKCPHCGARFRIPTEDREYSSPLDAGDAEGDSGRAVTEEAEESAADVAGGGPADEPPAAAPPAAGEPTFDPLADASTEWYVRPPSGGQYGPAQGAILRQWIGEGRVTATALVWRDGWAQWRDAAEVFPERFDSAEVAAPPPPPPGTPRAPVKGPAKEVAAGSPPAGSAREPVEAYLGSRRQRRTRRALLISGLVAMSLVLIAALVVALLWPR